MVRDEVVRRKLAHLSGYLDELDAYANVGLDTYLTHDGPRRAIERLIQLVVESAVDINVHICTEATGAPPPDYRSSFIETAGHGVFPADLAERLAPAAGLRNALTHDYADIDDVRVLDALPMVLSGFRDYTTHVTRWLDTTHR